MKRFIVMVAGLAIAVLLVIDGRAQHPEHGAAAVAAGASSSAHLVIPPDELKWEDAKMLPPGAKVALLEGDPSKEGFFAMRVKVPAGYKIPPHTHPGPERVTVLSGKFNMGMGERFDEKGAKALPAGSYAVMPPKTPHFAWAEGETVVQLATIGPWGITYVNPADDPRKP